MIRLRHPQRAAGAAKPPCGSPREIPVADDALTVFDGSRRLKPAARSQPRGFTLIEMVVVLSIILVILAFVVPAASALWAQRKESDAINMIQGLLMTTRASALQANGVEKGFLAYMDKQGVQRLVTIEQRNEGLSNPAWTNVFAVTNERSLALPAPMRVVPRYVVDDPNQTNVIPFTVFSAEELANQDFDVPKENQAQRHRNYFTMIFSTDGELLVNRDVLIRDENGNPGSGPGEDDRGDRTGLRVGAGPPAPVTTAQYYGSDDTKVMLSEPVPFLVVDPKDETTALNFPSVDGLLVYDDALFSQIADPAAKRSFLLRTAQPLYVSRLTGTMVRGPVGENETP